MCVYSGSTPRDLGTGTLLLFRRLLICGGYRGSRQECCLVFREPSRTARIVQGWRCFAYISESQCGSEIAKRPATLFTDVWFPDSGKFFEEHKYGCVMEKVAAHPAACVHHEIRMHGTRNPAPIGMPSTNSCGYQISELGAQRDRKFYPSSRHSSLAAGGAKPACWGVACRARKHGSILPHFANARCFRRRK